MRDRFRREVESGRTLVVPGAANALTARLIEEAGFPATYVTGAGVANTFLGVPDIGLLSLTEIATHVTAIRSAVETPLIVDADTGFGNAINTWHTVRTLERAGAAAIQLEDQTFPKRCGHFSGKSTVAAEEMVDKVRAAVEARTDPDLLIIARTDARAGQGLEEACRRARLYREAGADVTFVEAPQSTSEIEIISSEVPGPKVLNIVQGGKTPALPLERVQELGFSILLYANLPLLASIYAVRNVLGSLKVGDELTAAQPIATWSERQKTVRSNFFDDMSGRYETATPTEAAMSRDEVVLGN
ncbi:isocitrate lyase/PEP mutase family protein [Rhodococcus sp. GOMB7]|uniref:isocitrate lyase/PEP mutase family protein n=1 Tax=Rhodococcus sp. GOMB7 TaxID=2839033 RepID=UPI001C00493E|nr:isocitrate lyase/PEP mutase family protein [Rhodococcus sp. GOMB7]MBT9299348.1 isocitrate lyase/PEP mutase family protein [Rhodococcus sp. GOMB7]